MANRCIKYIIVLLACWCCHTSVAYSQDSSAIAKDTVAAANTYVDSVLSEPPPGDTVASEVYNKFLPRGKQPVIAERKLPDSSVQKLKKDTDFWYANKEAGKPKAETQEEDKSSFWDSFFQFLASDFMRAVFWILIIGGLLAVIVIYLTNNKVRLFASRSKKISAKNDVAEDVVENIFTMDFEARIAKAQAEQNYRLATRLLFLKVLRTMTEKSIINYGIDKTNMDYMFQLVNTLYFKDFAQASRMYEYVWYGNFTIEQSQFMHIRQQIEQLNKKINS